MVELLATIILAVLAILVGIYVLWFVGLALFMFALTIVMALANIVTFILRPILWPFLAVGSAIYRKLPGSPAIHTRERVSLAITWVGVTVFFFIPALLITLNTTLGD